MTNDVKIERAKAPKKRKIASLDKKKARAGWIFILPFLIGFILVYFPIVVDSIKLSFMDYDEKTSEVIFVGFQNYGDAFFNEPKFVQALLGGLSQMVLDIPSILIFSLFMAVLLNQKMAGRAFFRAILFVPVIISTGIMEVINAKDINMGAVEGGIDDGSGGMGGGVIGDNDLDWVFDWLFGNMKIGGELSGYVVDMVNNIFNIVNRSGVQLLIFLSGLQSISPAIYESCQIDGASAWETFWKITFPMISPMILVNAIYTIIDSFTSQSNVVMKYITETGRNTTEYLKSAMSWSYFIIIIAIVGAFAAIFSMFVFYQRRND